MHFRTHISGSRGVCDACTGPPIQHGFCPVPSPRPTVPRPTWTRRKRSKTRAREKWHPVPSREASNKPSHIDHGACVGQLFSSARPSPPPQLTQSHLSWRRSRQEPRSTRSHDVFPTRWVRDDLFRASPARREVTTRRRRREVSGDEL